MLKASYCRYFLAFNEPAVTSRSTMRIKETYFIKVWESADPLVFGVGECAVFRGLSSDDISGYEEVLSQTCRYIHLVDIADLAYSSIRFGFETALRDLANGGRRIIADTPWSRSESVIRINGLIWMGDYAEMLKRIRYKVSAGFRCLKLKIGGIGFDEELKLLRLIRERFNADELELRLDANESFPVEEAMDKLSRLADYHIHSIEQPIKRGQWNHMTYLSQNSPIPIALDEELIGCRSYSEKCDLLKSVNPRYIILKPSLCGGLADADEWIDIAEGMGVGWWATSALESNIGLNAIAQWVSQRDIKIPQGLGTGLLYRNNIESPLRQKDDFIRYSSNEGRWDLSGIIWKS